MHSINHSGDENLLKMYHYDLHTHSHFSDGALSPTKLVQAAHQLGIDYLALTDHDSVSGIAEAKAAAQDLPISIINGVEISTNHTLATSKRGMSVHIVGLGFTDMAAMNTDLQKIQTQRESRAIAICEKLHKKTGQDFYADVLMLANDNPKAITRSHIAKVLVEKAVVAKYQQAFDKYLAQGKAAYVPIDVVNIHDAIQMIHKAGGKAVLAHPTRYQLSGMNIRRLVGDFARLGGDAVELPPKKDPPATRGLIDRCVALHGLMVSVCSDFHGDHMPWLKLGDVPSKTPNQVGVWEVLH